MRKLVIGCGYLGERVARAWQQQGSEVFALTRSTETAARFRSLGIVPIVGDVLQPETLIFPEEIATCLYAVGLDRTSNFSQRNVYVGGLSNVLQAESFSPRELIYISSTSVYGQEDGSWVDETSPTESETESGRVCRDAEELIRSQSKSPANVIRLSGIYGPGRLLARIDQLKNREPLRGNPEAWLNLIHVEDACRAVLACEATGRASETYLVSDDRPVIRREYYTRLAELAEAPEPVFQNDSASLGKRCRNRKARSELQLELKFPSIEAGLPPLFADEPL
ncbi:MAG TPA: SDR family oxidoreductase [Planctomycetaceae bacterium]|nr:SDR family oxidoreductase [Planctomycetaceae bacterium]